MPVNHTHTNKKVSHEITNNILGNSTHADLTQKFHEPNTYGHRYALFVNIQHEGTFSHVMILVSPKF